MILLASYGFSGQLICIPCVLGMAITWIFMVAASFLRQDKAKTRNRRQASTKKIVTSFFAGSLDFLHVMESSFEGIIERTLEMEEYGGEHCLYYCTLRFS